MSELPTGTVTLLLADVGGTTRPWEPASAEMTARAAQPDRAPADVITAHSGVVPVGQGEATSVLAAFTRASDAVACALDLQRTPPAPIRWRIGVHTGEAQLHDDACYVGATVESVVHLRDLAHPGQTLLSDVTRELVEDHLPAQCWLIDLGSYRLGGAPDRARVAQVCHPELVNEFPPPQTRDTVLNRHFPVQLTRFVGRETELSEVRQLVCNQRLVTLTGAGGVGKTRLAIQLAAQLTDRFNAEVCYVDLAPITDPNLVAVRVARTLGLPDQPGRSMLDTLIRFIADRQMLVVLDNCEHLLEGCSTLVSGVLVACPGLTILATSREPIGVNGEVTWLTPSLSLADEAIELFTDRARLTRPDFLVVDDSAALVAEICRRLDGMPLAIELAAARVRTLSLNQIVDGLHDRFQLLTGRARTAMPRHQTLRASVDWSHALLSEPEHVLFRRLAVFMGGFDLDAAHIVAGGGELERYQILDELSLLVDKSMVMAQDNGPTTRYRLLETLRHYALEKLGESGEADTMRSRHRDYYTMLVESPLAGGHQQQVERAEIEIDNLRAAFGWSREQNELDLAARLASSLQPLWLTRSRIVEGMHWFDSVLSDDSALTPAARARALADKVTLGTLTGSFYRMDEAGQALAIARELDDPALRTQALAAYGFTCSYSPELASPFLEEAAELARAGGDDWQLSRILGWQAFSSYIGGDPAVVGTTAERGRALAVAIGDGWVSRLCGWCVGLAQWLNADLAGATARFRQAAAEAQEAHEPMASASALMTLGITLAFQGDTTGARAAAEAAVETAAVLPELQRGASFGALVDAALAAGDVDSAVAASHAALQACALAELFATNGNPVAKAALACGDLSEARHWADVAVAAGKGVHRVMLLAVRVRVAIAQGEMGQAERDACDALAIAAEAKTYLTVPDVIECLAGLTSDSGHHLEAARLFGSAQAIREHTGQVRFKVYDADYRAAVTTLRDTLGETAFESTWAEGAALTPDEAVSYALRGRGPRKRPASGWASLTRTERDVAQLISEGLTNNDIAARLFISPRTVQTHLTHIYNKLGLTSRVQLAQKTLVMSGLQESAHGSDS